MLGNQYLSELVEYFCKDRDITAVLRKYKTKTGVKKLFGEVIELELN